MKIPVWHEGKTQKEATDGAYWERNMLALYMAIREDAMLDEYCRAQDDPARPGWYYDEDHKDDPAWAGWLRVISLFGGTVTFHIPDSFDVGNLRQIKPNWDGHTTEEKWRCIMEECGCRIDED